MVNLRILQFGGGPLRFRVALDVVVVVCCEFMGVELVDFTVRSSFGDACIWS